MDSPCVGVSTGPAAPDRHTRQIRARIQTPLVCLHTCVIFGIRSLGSTATEHTAGASREGTEAAWACDNYFYSVMLALLMLRSPYYYRRKCGDSHVHKIGFISNVIKQGLFCEFLSSTILYISVILFKITQHGI